MARRWAQRRAATPLLVNDATSGYGASSARARAGPVCRGGTLDRAIGAATWRRPAAARETDAALARWPRESRPASGRDRDLDTSRHRPAVVEPQERESGEPEQPSAGQHHARSGAIPAVGAGAACRATGQLRARRAAYAVQGVRRTARIHYALRRGVRRHP